MIHTLIQLAESWWPLYAVHMLETSLFILVVWAVDRWVHLDTRLRYSLWLCALVKIFVPPFYALPLPAFLSEAPIPVQPATLAGQSAWSEMSYVAPVALPPEPIPMVFWAFALWAVSVIVFVGMTLWRNLAFQRTLGIANPVSLSGDLDDLTQGANLKVFSKANLTSPLLVGVVKPRLYLPSTWQSWTPTQLRGIVAHELAHYHNRDLWALAFQVLATVFCGLNPLIWLVNRRLAHLRELRCDEDALLKSGISPVEYGKLLYAFLDANAHPGLPALGFNEKDTPLKKRFEHVLNFKGGTMKRSKWQYVIPVLVALAIVPFSIRETYSQAPSQLPSEALNLRQEMISKGSYGMMFKKRTSEVKLDLMEVTAPEYPKALSTQGIEGNIELELLVGIDGRVEQVMRVGGDERFEQVAIDALKKARFLPPQNGQSIKLFQKILFRLKDEKGLVIELPNTFWNTSDMGEMVVWARSQKSAQQKRLKIKPIKQIPPVYPEDARLDGIEGFVIMDVTIDSGGQVRHVTMLDGNRRFEAAAKTALEHFRYTPFTHTQSIKKAEAMVFKLSGDNWPEYNLPEGLITPSKFESYLTVVAKAPKREKIGDGILEQQEQNEKSVESEQRIIDGGQILDASQVDEKPHPVRIVTPQYPEEAKAQGIEGNVLVSGLVNTDGTVSDLKIVSGDEMFHESALVAAKQMRFRPAKHQGQTVPVRLTMPMDFQLKGSQNNGQIPLGLTGGLFRNKRMSEIWINTKGDLLIDQSKAVTLETLGSELAQLKEQKNIDTILLKPDVKTPMAHVQKVLDVVGQSGLKVHMFSFDQAEFKERNRPKDLNNIEFYQADVKPEPIHRVSPVYPEIAEKAGLTGKVFLKFRVNVDGSVSDVSVLRGQQIFRQAAIEAIEKFRFKPAEYDGKIVAVWMTQPVSFRLGLGKPLEAQTLDLGTFTINVPNGHYGNALIQPRLTLNVISTGAADVITDDLGKAQKIASSYLSSIPLDQWVSAEQQNAILEGVREQVNVGFGAPLINSVTFSNLTLTPSEYLAENREFKLHTNFPNPFNPETAIQYEVAEPVFVRMEIYNVTGQVIRTLVAEDKAIGQYETRWDGKDDQGHRVASGVYYYHINAGSFNAVKKMQLVK